MPISDREVVCADCHYENRSGVKYCEGCGHDLGRACGRCGGLGPVGRNFCGHCGETLASSHYTPTVTTATRYELRDQAASEHRYLTVLFCDLVGSTRLAQRLTPEQLGTIIGQFNDTAQALIVGHGGYVARYMGDGVLAYFGYPHAFEDNAERGVRAGLAIVGAVTQLTDGLGRTLQARVGLATGPVMTGVATQTDAVIETLALGDTPNIAARLQAFARPSTVVAAESTKCNSHAAFHWRDLGTRQLKDFLWPHQLWGVTAIATRTTTAIAHSPPLLARAHELSILHKSWRRARQGESPIVHLSGDTGFGKTRLVREFCAAVAAPWLIHLHGSARERREHLHPLRNWLARLLAPEPAQSLFANFTRAIRRWVTPEPDALICLAHTLGLEVAMSARVKRLSAWQRQRLAFQLGLTIVLEFAARESLLLVIEDVHDLDSMSAQWLTELLAHRELTHCLCVLTTRPNATVRAILPAKTRELMLKPLSVRDCETLIAARPPRLSCELVTRMVAQADGVPLFIEAITQSVQSLSQSESQSASAARTGTLRTEKWRGDGQLAARIPLNVPAALQDILMARIDRVAWGRDVVQIAAVIGRVFSTELVQKISRRPPRELRTILSALAQAEVIRRRSMDELDEKGEMDGAITWEFKYALLRDAAYENILCSHRQQLHHKIAIALQDELTRGTNVQRELLAYHLSQTDDLESALENWLKAAVQARMKGANAHAMSHLYAALAELPRLKNTTQHRLYEMQVQVQFGEAVCAVHGSHTILARRAYQAAFAVGRAYKPTHRAIVLAIYHGAFVTHFAAAQLTAAERLARALSIVGKRHHDPLFIIAGRQALGLCAFARGKFAAAYTHLQAALTLGHTLPKSTARKQKNYRAMQFPQLTQVYLMQVLYQQHKIHTAFAFSRYAVERARKTAPSEQYALILAHTCYLHQFRHDYPAMTRLAKELKNLALAKDLPPWLAISKFLLSWVECTQKPSTNSAKHLIKTLQWWGKDASDMPIEMAYFKSIASVAVHKAGARAIANRLSSEAKTLMTTSGVVWYRPALSASTSTPPITQRTPPKRSE